MNVVDGGALSDTKRNEKIIFVYWRDNRIRETLRHFMATFAYLPQVADMMTHYSRSGTKLAMASKHPYTWSYDFASLYSRKLQELAVRIAEYEHAEVHKRFEEWRCDTETYPQRMQNLRDYIDAGFSYDQIIADREMHMMQYYIDKDPSNIPSKFHFVRALSAIKIMICIVDAETNAFVSPDCQEDAESVVTMQSASSSSSLTSEFVTEPDLSFALPAPSSPLPTKLDKFITPEPLKKRKVHWDDVYELPHYSAFDSDIMTEAVQLEQAQIQELEHYDVHLDELVTKTMTITEAKKKRRRRRKWGTY